MKRRVAERRRSISTEVPAAEPGTAEPTFTAAVEQAPTKPAAAAQLCIVTTVGMARIG